MNLTWAAVIVLRSRATAPLRPSLPVALAGPTKWVQGAFFRK